MNRREAWAAAVLLGWAAALVCSGGSELNAQSVRLRPHAGLYLPSRVSIQHGVLHVRQKMGVTVGARLSVAFNERFDVVTGVTYIPGYATFTGAGKQIDVGTVSHLLTGTTGARYWLLPRARTMSWEVHSGLGAVFGGQPAYGDLFESSTLSGILGTTLRYRIRRIASLHLRIQDRVYRVRVGGRDAPGARAPLRMAVGLSLPFQEPAP